MLKFLHAADIHLDSPLKGLERYEGAPVDQIRQATRRALENLVRFALDERVDFVLIAGDLYDGGWKDYNTGLFIIAQMEKLRQAGIRVFVIAGNHDAVNKMDKTLRLPDNVHLFRPDQAETQIVDECGVAIHGQSFRTQAVHDDLSQAYPATIPGCFNIGLLHTCATGSDGHEPYAPCTVDGLRSKEYGYWALGHIHKRQDLRTDSGDPPIVFPGNIQGRHIRETGAKGCVLVTVDDTHRIEYEFIPLDVLRWERCTVDAGEAEDGEEILSRFAAALREQLQTSDGLPLAVRVEIAGMCAAHELLACNPQHWISELRGAAVQESGGQVWIEKVKFATSPAVEFDELAADGPIGELIQLIDEFRGEPKKLKELSAEFNDLKSKLPAELLDGHEAVRLDDPQWLGGTLEQVEQILRSRLMVRRSAS